MASFNDLFYMNHGKEILYRTELFWYGKRKEIAICNSSRKCCFFKCVQMTSVIRLMGGNDGKWDQIPIWSKESYVLLNCQVQVCLFSCPSEVIFVCDMHCIDFSLAEGNWPHQLLTVSACCYSLLDVLCTESETQVCYWSSSLRKQMFSCCWIFTCVTDVIETTK